MIVADSPQEYLEIAESRGLFAPQRHRRFTAPLGPELFLDDAPASVEEAAFVVQCVRTMFTTELQYFETYSGIALVAWITKDVKMFKPIVMFRLGHVLLALAGPQ